MTTTSTASRRPIEDGEAEQSWSDLPDGPLHTILMCLWSLVNLISFKSVCRSWRAVASSLTPSVIASLFPPLLLCPTRLQCCSTSSFCVLDPASPSFSSILFFNLSKFIFFHVCCSHGHLLAVFCNRIVIINIFTRDELCSPILPQNHKLSTPTHRVFVEPTFYVLTSPPSTPDSGLLVFTKGPLLYWRIGSSSWSFHWPKKMIMDGLGIVTVQGKVYATNALDYSLLVIDISPKLHMRPLEVEGIKEYSFFLRHFLVDCGGELLQVRLVLTDIWHAHFEAFRLDLSVNKPRWVKKKTLGNWAIFVGYEFRMSGLAVENPERWGGKSNCVYFSRVDEEHDSLFSMLKLGEQIDMSKPKSPSHLWPS